MKKICFIIFALFLVQSINADEIKIHVQSFDEEVDLSSLESELISPSSSLPIPKSVTSTLPSPQVMERHYKEAGLEKELENFDQMDRDLFYLKVRERSVEKLISTYPQISSHKIKLLKSLQEKSK